jgi:hypothetical protein
MFTPIPILEAMQVRFSEGLQIPVIFLAVETLFYFEKKYLRRKNFKLRFWALLLIFFSLSNLLIFTSTFWRIRTPEAPWFYKTNEIEVMRWLGKNSTEDEVVLSLEWSGNHIPTQANIHVYVGQLFATINYHEKRKNAEEFYGEEMTEEEAWCFLYVNGIDWVFIGSQELGTSFLPEQKPFLLKSFSAGESAIYRVIKPPSTLQCNAPTN